MNQCVPSWDLDDNPTPPRVDYEVAELTWENGQLAMHGLGPPKVPNKPVASSAGSTKYTWDKQHAGGTLESIVDQATRHPTDGKAAANGGTDELVPWFDHRRVMVNPKSNASATMTMDALVPCTNISNQDPVLESVSGVGACVVGCSTRLGSCSGAAKAAVAPVGMDSERDWNSKAEQSVTVSGRDSHQLTLDTCDRDLGSPENTSSAKDWAKTGEHYDSACHSRSERERETGNGEDKKKGSAKSSISTKRSRAAAIHNQSERKRRDKINQRMKTLQKLVPNSSKTDKASMLDEVIEYLKQLQAQVQMINRINSMSSLMMPLAMQQQLQMMGPMAGMGMGMAAMAGMGPGMGVMDLNTLGRAFLPPGLAVQPPPHFMTPTASASAMPTDPFSTFLACQSQQPMSMEANYNRMAALYQQLQQHHTSGSKI